METFHVFARMHYALLACCPDLLCVAKRPLTDNGETMVCTGTSAPACQRHLSKDVILKSPQLTRICKSKVEVDNMERKLRVYLVFCVMLAFA